MAKGFTKDGKFRPTGNNGSSSKEKSIEPTGRKICADFLVDSASHRPNDDGNHTNQIFYESPDGERCASELTDEEFSTIITDDTVANTFQPIGKTAEKWEKDEKFRERILDRALEIIEERKNG